MSLDKLNAISAEVKSLFVGRNEVIDYLKLSAIAQTHMLVLGPTGAAKSAAIEEYLSRLGGRKGFFQLTKGDAPEKLVGPMSIQAMKTDDEFRYNIKDMAPDVEYLWIDEVFKGNTLTRNATLSIIQERKFKNGSEIVRCPLRFAVGASNEYPDANEDAAFFDRFLVRLELDYLPDHMQRMQMVDIARRTRSFGDHPPQITLEEMDELHERSRLVTIPDDVDEAAAKLYDDLSAIGPDAIPGDRRFAQTFMLAAAKAVTHERDYLIPDDLEVFTATAWKTPEVRKEVGRTVLKVISPELADVTVYFDEIEGCFDTLRERVTTETTNHHAIILAHQEFKELVTHNIEKIEHIVFKMEREKRDATRARDFYSRARSRIKEAEHLTRGAEEEVLV